jgi:hypothetical protein
MDRIAAGEQLRLSQHWPERGEVGLDMIRDPGRQVLLPAALPIRSMSMPMRSTPARSAAPANAGSLVNRVSTMSLP